MPEIEVTAEQIASIAAWIENKHGDFVGSVNKGSSRARGIWIVDYEPLTIGSYVSADPNKPPEFLHMLCCSNSHAKAMEAAGILKFEEGEEDAD